METVVPALLGELQSNGVAGFYSISQAESR